MLKATVVAGNYQWHQVKAWSLQKRNREEVLIANQSIK